jgi:hypothetical protein
LLRVNRSTNFRNTFPDWHLCRREVVYQLMMMPIDRMMVLWSQQIGRVCSVIQASCRSRVLDDVHVCGDLKFKTSFIKCMKQNKRTLPCCCCNCSRHFQVVLSSNWKETVKRSNTDKNEKENVFKHNFEIFQFWNHYANLTEFKYNDCFKNDFICNKDLQEYTNK